MKEVGKRSCWREEEYAEMRGGTVIDGRGVQTNILRCKHFPATCLMKALDRGRDLYPVVNLHAVKKKPTQVCTKSHYKLNI